MSTRALRKSVDGPMGEDGNNVGFGGERILTDNVVVAVDRRLVTSQRAELTSWRLQKGLNIKSMTSFYRSLIPSI